MPARRKPVLVLVILAVAGAGAVAWWMADRSAVEQEAFSGTIEATEVRVKAEVPGRIVDLPVEEGQAVRAGDVVARLDDAALKAQVRQSEAALAAARARFEDAAAGGQPALVRQARANLSQAEARRDQARRDLDRLEALARDGAATQNQLEAARSALAVAEQQAAAASAALELAQKGATGRAVDALEAAVNQSKAALDLARLQAEKAVVRAPLAGIVSARAAEKGEMVGTGVTIAMLVDISRLWVRVYLPVTRLGKVRVGQRVEVRPDTFPGKVFPGRVASIGTQAEFTPRNVQTPRERVNQVFAVKVVVEDPSRLLRPGVPVDVVLPETAPAPPAGRS